jgi:CheY-like chemotaxis protein
VHVDGTTALKILVVEDDDGDALVIEEALARTETPSEMRRVADGQEAIDYLRRQGAFADAQRPDVVFLDLNLPRVDGREVLVEVKSDDELKSIPIVVLTTSDAITDVLSSYQHRANAYVTKPMNLEDFETAVREIDRFFREVALLPR